MMSTKIFTSRIIALATLVAGLFLTSCKNKIDPFDSVISGIISNMVTVQGGTFAMVPGRNVTLSNFSMSKHQVTQEQWYAVMATNPSYFTGAKLPVEQVSWNMIVGTTGATMTIDGMTYYENGFVYKLNQLTGKKFRLPTDAEWQYAASGGRFPHGYDYSGSDAPGSVAWFDGNSGHTTHQVGTKAPNNLGLYDMSGNVWEWCYDAYSTPLATGPFTNPVGTAGSDRVLRGGCWYSDVLYTAVSIRLNGAPSHTKNDIGFRLACSLN